MARELVEFGVTSILNTKQFSWVFLVECIMVLLLSLFVTFYFNQFVCWFLSRALSWYLWKHYRKNVVIGSLQISFFGGQIFVKNVKYVGTDMAVSIVYATLHWRFWLRKARVAALFAENLDQIQKAECALHCEVHGFEVFFFNRSVAYDDIEAMVNGVVKEQPLIDKKLGIAEEYFMRLLPLQIEIHRLAIVSGNKDTESLLVLASKRIDMVLDIDRASNEFDRYMIVATSKWKRPRMTLYPNLDYQQSKNVMFNPERGPWYRLGRTKKRQAAEAWRGLNRYNPKEDDVMHPNDATPDEYARVSTAFEAEEMSLEYVVDMAGPVVESEKPLPPPLWNINIVFTSGVSNYGPWADRQRAQLMQTFFPQIAVDQTAAEALPGTMRLTPKLKVTFDFVGTFNVHIPIREFSKDMEWTHHLINSQAANITRPYGWCDFVADEGSNGSLEFDLIASDYGFRNKVYLFLKNLEMGTSVNHDLAIKTREHTINVVQNAPLKWNGLQTWDVEHHSEGVQFFFLREHASLITDYFKDHANTSEVDYDFFVPTIYNITWTVSDFQLLLNVNNQNVINNPTSMIENTFLIFKTDHVVFNVDVLADQVCMLTNTSKITISTEQLDLEISAPPWHTLHSFLESNHLGRVHDFRVDVAYTYNCTEHSTRPETEVMNVSGRDFTLVAHGFAINYLMNIRENYFGQNFHFQTSEEYHRKLEVGGDDITEEYEFSRYDADLDVQMHFDVTNCCLVLPSYLYSARGCLALHFARLVADMRFTNYYMDFQNEFTPVTGYLHHDLELDVISDLAQRDPSELDGTSVLFVSDTIISAHRMFGLPPSEPTYLCYWRITFGDILLDGPFDMIDVLSRIAMFSEHSFDGLENKPIIVEPALYDVTFLFIEIKSLSIILHASEGSRLELRTSTVSLDKNDLANERYSGRMSGSIPNIELRGYSENELVALLNTSLTWSGFTTVPSPERHYQLQQEHIALHDMLFHRCPFLLDIWHRSNPPYSTEPPDHIVPQIAIPPLPPQLTQQIVMSANPQTIALDFERDLSSKFSASSRSQYTGSNSNLFSSADSSASSDDSESSARARANYRPVDCSFGNAENFYGFLPPQEFEQGHAQRPDHDFKLESHEWYPGAPFLAAPDKSRTYKDMVVEVGPLKGSILPQTVQLIDTITLSLSGFDVVAAFDRLHCKLVRELAGSVEKECIRTSVRASSVAVRFGLAKETDKGIFEDQAEEDSLLEPNYILLNAEKVGLMVQAGNDKVPKVADLDIESLTFSINSPEDALTSTAVSLRVSQVAGWLVIDDAESAGQIHADNLDFFWSEYQTRWVTDYVLRLIYEINRLKKLTQAKVSRHDEMAYAMLEVARASEHHHIEQDSYVLSRPFGGGQTSDHVRSHISWRISVRLRHLLNFLPPEEIENMESVLSSRNYIVPDDAKKQVVDVFSRWRSWELTEDLQTALIFTRTFSQPASKWDDIGVAFRGEIDSIAARLNYQDQSEDFLVLDYSALFGSLRPTVGTVFTSLLLTCARSRSHVSNRIFGPVATVLRTAALFEHPELFDDLFSRPDAEPVKTGRQKNAREVKGFVLAFIQDFGFEIALNSFSAELQCNQLQAMSAFILSSNNWYHSTMSAMSSSCLSVVRPNGDELFDYIMESVGLGLVRWETFTRISFISEALSLISNARLVEICIVATEFIKTDLEPLNEFADMVSSSISQIKSDQDLRNSESTRSGSTQTESSEAEDVPLHLNVHVNALTIKMNLIENLHIVLKGETLVVRTRQPDMVTNLADFHIDHGDLGVVYGENARVGNIELTDISSLLRYEPELGAVETLLAIKIAKLDTMELLWLLDLLKEKNFFSEIDTMSEVISSVTVNYSDALETLPSSVSLDQPPLAVESLSRFSIQLGEAQISLPLHDSTFTVIMRYFTGQCYNFKRDSRDVPQRCALELFGSLDEFRIELARTSSFTPSTPIPPPSPGFKPPILALQLTAAYSYEDNNQRVQISSSYCKILLDPARAVAILQAVAKLESRSTFFETLDKAPAPSYRKSASADFFSTLQSISTVLSLHNQSFTWQASEGGSLVVGHEALKVRQNGLTARMDVNGFYVQPEASSLRRTTRAELPHIVLAAVALPDGEDNYFVYLHNTGESLNIDISASVVPLLVALADSLDETKRLYSAGLSENPPRARRGSLSSPTLRRSPIRLPFSLYGHSAISRARLRLFEEYSAESTPALELHSPAANIVVDYRRRHMPLRDTLTFEVNITESANTVYPRALQEICNIVRMMKYEMHNRRPADTAPAVAVGASLRPQPASEPTTPTKPRRLRIRTDVESLTESPPTSNVSDLKVMLSNIEFTLSLNLAAQQLTLSCEPFAKVATTLLYDSVKIIFTSPRDDDDIDYFALSGTVKGARVSLQHIYSHERSADAGIGLLTFTLMHRHRSSSHPVELGLLTANPNFNLKVNKLSDIQSFIDIWTPIPTAAAEAMSPSSPNPSAPSGSNEMSPLQTYRKAMASVSFQWSFIWHIREVKGRIDLGQSIGKAEVSLDRVWISSLKKSQNRQIYAVGLGHLTVSCEGRVGGALEVKGTNAHLTVELNEEVDQTPEILFIAGVPSVDAYLSLDFNPFLALCIERSSLAMGNTQNAILDYDDLDISYQCERASATFTALAASHLYDILDMVGTFKIPPNPRDMEVGDDDPVAIRKREINLRSLNLMTRLKVRLHMSLGETVLYVFPTDLGEASAMCVSSGGAATVFTQWIDHRGVHSEFEFETRSLLMSLAAMSTAFDSGGDVTSLQVDRFFREAAHSTKSNIIAIPKCKLQMYARLEPNGRKLHYKFLSDFMGTVEVGWNLGSVAFIREIGNVHSKAWELRKKIFMASQDAQDMPAEGEFSALPKSPARVPKHPAQGPRHSAIDDDGTSFVSLEEFGAARKLLESLLNSDLRFAEIPKYSFIEPPQINIPQLHDMGEATPPVEWIGIDRQKLPEAVHWYLIRALNAIILEVEQVYGKVIEHM